MKNSLFLMLLLASAPSFSSSNEITNQLVYNVNSISVEGNQQVKFIDKKGECYYFGEVKQFKVKHDNRVFGVKIGESETNRYKFYITRKVCRDMAYDVSLFPAPTKKLWNTNDNTLLSSGTEFRVFSSEEEMKIFLQTH
ncbi:hypothetical protein WKH15_21725 [Pantoea agglomerans]|uniref:hypothetical protein n=1 Tax=Enterobacter agglomerans TaxID=549 RepID=UPI003C7E85D5